jgi:HEAT repeat protein
VQLESAAHGLPAALRAFVLSSSLDHFGRGEAAKALIAAGDTEVVPALLRLFAQQTDPVDLYTTGLTMEMLRAPALVSPLIKALLHDENPGRRRAAARALGWMQPPSRKAARALAECLADRTQPQPVRVEAAESLAYAGNRSTINALISAIDDADVAIRFWAVFGLGSSCGAETRAAKALESRLNDDKFPPGWWSVGKEALAMLGRVMRPPLAEYSKRLRDEINCVLSDPTSSDEDQRWAEGYRNS